MHCTEIMEVFYELNGTVIIRFFSLPFLYHPEEKQQQKVMYTKVLTNSSDEAGKN